MEVDETDIPDESADSEESITVTPCLICGKETSKKGQIIIFSTENEIFTHTTQSRICDKLGNIVGCSSSQINSLSSNILCKQCFNLINQVDDLEFRTNQLRNHITTMFLKQNHFLSSGKDFTSCPVSDQVSNCKKEDKHFCEASQNISISTGKSDETHKGTENNVSFSKT